MNVLGSLILNDSQQNTPHVKRPNIVFIVADDVGMLQHTLVLLFILSLYVDTEYVTLTLQAGMTWVG